MQNSDELKALIKEDLNEGEEVIWAGRPTQIKLLDMPYGSSIIIRWIICLVIVVFALWYGLIFVTSAENLRVSSNTIMLVCILIAAFIALRPVMDVSKLQKKCCYFITNQRAITIISGSTRKFKDKLFADVSDIAYDIIADDRGNVYIGPKLKNSQSKARVSALTPTMDSEEEKNRPHIFYNVAEPAEVVKFFPDLNAGV